MYMPFKKGKMIRIFLESDSSKITITHSDLKGTVLSGNSVKLPSGYSVLEVITDIHTVANGTASTFGTRKVYADGCQAVEIPDAKNFDYGYLYIHVNKEK